VGVDTREGRGCYAAGVAAPGLSGAICAQVTRCQKRPGVSNDVDHRRRNWKAKHGSPPGRRMLCGWRCGYRLTASQMRAHFTICAKRPAGLDHVADAGGELASHAWGPTRAADEMRLDCGAQFTGRRNMRTHFTICPKRPAASDHDRQGRNSKPRAGPTGPRMLCGWQRPSAPPGNS